MSNTDQQRCLITGDGWNGCDVMPTMSLFVPSLQTIYGIDVLKLVDGTVAILERTFPSTFYHPHTFLTQLHSVTPPPPSSSSSKNNDSSEPGQYLYKTMYYVGGYHLLWLINIDIFPNICPTQPQFEKHLNTRNVSAVVSPTQNLTKPGDWSMFSVASLPVCAHNKLVLLKCCHRCSLANFGHWCSHLLLYFLISSPNDQIDLVSIIIWITIGF